MGACLRYVFSSEFHHEIKWFSLQITFRETSSIFRPHIHCLLTFDMFCICLVISLCTQHRGTEHESLQKIHLDTIESGFHPVRLQGQLKSVLM